jgi:hypothetical protein
MGHSTLAAGEALKKLNGGFENVVLALNGRRTTALPVVGMKMAKDACDQRQGQLARQHRNRDHDSDRHQEVSARKKFLAERTVFDIVGRVCWARITEGPGRGRYRTYNMIAVNMGLNSKIGHHKDRQQRRRNDLSE